MLTVSQLSKSFAGRALFDDVFYFFPRANQAEARGTSTGEEKLNRLNAESPMPQTGWGRALSEIAGPMICRLISPYNTIIIFTERRSAK